MKYWDSSAVVPLLVREPASAALRRVLNADRRLIVWWGTPVECVSAIARRERDGGLEVAAANTAVGRLRELTGSWIEVRPSARVRSIALRLLRTHALRASDSLQLAAALVAADEDPGGLPLVCLDERLAAAARREGFEVVP